MKRKDMIQKVVETVLQGDTGLNDCFIKDFYYLIKELPFNTTFVKLKNKRLERKTKLQNEVS